MPSSVNLSDEGFFCILFLKNIIYSFFIDEAKNQIKMDRILFKTNISLFSHILNEK